MSLELSRFSVVTGHENVIYNILAYASWLWRNIARVSIQERNIW